jgi:hypothetical protein
MKLALANKFTKPEFQLNLSLQLLKTIQMMVFLLSTKTARFTEV